MNLTLQLHYARQFLKYFALVLAGLSALVILFDLLELFRRSADKSYIDSYDVLRLAGFKLWQSIYLVFPFAVAISAMVFFLRKLHTNELLALKAFGSSSLQILIAPLVCVAVIGLFNMMVVNHISAQFSKEFETLERSLFRQNTNRLSLSEQGLWLREENEGNRRTLIYAESAADSGQLLQNLQVFLLTDNNYFLQRISAGSATLHNGYWLLRDADVLDGRGDVRKLDFYLLETELTTHKIENGVFGPNSLSLWELPQFIGDLQLSGFNALSYRLQLQRLLAEPLFLLSVLVLCAAFLLHVKRRDHMRQMLKMAFFTVLMVVALYVVNNLIYAWGLQGHLPIAVAAWSPPIIGLCLASAILLRLEQN